MAPCCWTLPAASIRRWAISMLVVVGAGSSAAWAQERPYAALFGGAGNAPVARQVLDGTISLAEAYDTNVLAQNATVGPRSPFQVGGVFTALTGDARYMLQGKRAQFNAHIGTNIRYFPRLKRVTALGHYLTVDTALPLGRATTIRIKESVAYTPSYLYGLFAQAQLATAPQFSAAAQPAVSGQVATPAANYVVNPLRSYTSATALNVSHNLSRRVTVDLTSGYRMTEFSGSTSTRANLTVADAGGHVAYVVNRDLTLRLGYSYREARYSTGRRPREHDIDIGFGYTRPLSRSRRTLLGFNLGTSAVDAPPPGRLTAANVRQYRASANAILTHQIGRTWTTRAIYHRGGQFIPELSVPTFTDAVTITADGFVNRRTDIGAAASYTTGALFGQRSSGFDTATGSLRARTAITRKMALYAEYLYYFYDFSSGVQLAAPMPSQVGRHSVRVGLTLWVPVLRK